MGGDDAGERAVAGQDIKESLIVTGDGNFFNFSGGALFGTHPESPSSEHIPASDALEQALAEYRRARVAALSNPRDPLDTRFVKLSLLIDQGEEVPQRFAVRHTFDDLRSVLAKTSDDPAIVVLGAPGAGKSTLLKHLELTTAQAGLRGETDRVAFYAALAGYKPARKEGRLQPEPLEWLSTLWSAHAPGRLTDLLDTGRVLLLLDALNEIPHNDTDDYTERVDLWRAFIQERVRKTPGNRAVCTCRSHDNIVLLSTDEVSVPQVRVEPLDDSRVREFLVAYLPSDPEAAAVWTQLDRDRKLLDLFRAPYFLKMLTDQIQDGGRVPEGRAQLFCGFVRRLFKREMVKNPKFATGGLLSTNDRRRLADDGAARRNPLLLPDQGPLIPAFSTLAYRMQDVGDQSELNQVRIRHGEVSSLISAPERPGGIIDADEFVDIGCALALLDYDHDLDQVMFHHQLLQEFFAARRLAEAPDPHKWRVEWREGKVLAVEWKNDFDPLPPLPGTGWEETTVIAAGLVENSDAFVRAVLAENPPLAARCAAQSEARVSGPVKGEIRGALLARMGDSAADLRARIAAGLALGNIGDPRFERRRGTHGDYLLPPMVKIPAGKYPIGSDAYDDEKPPHEVQLESFQIGVFPVTNAEYAAFIAADGYEDETWWDTEAARAWRRGEGVAEGQKQGRRDYRKTLQSWTEDDLRGLARDNQVTSKEVDDWITERNWSDERFEKWLDEQFPYGVRYTLPRFWDDEAFNNPAQPVVGICWHEARAYCAWLTVQSGQSFRLPTEVEFEAAARGFSGREYTYGTKFDSARCNTFESHIRRSTPVGIFANATPEGAFDLSGNVWEWSSSRFESYPYRPEDGREGIEGTSVRLVLRGGSWSYDQAYARAACRYDYYVGDRYGSVGARLAAPVIF